MSKITKSIFALAVCAATMGLASCNKDNTASCPCTDRESMYQVATLQSLMAGNYDGFVTVEELAQKGDIGLGTFDSVDGEMIVLDGTVYQARYDGTVQEAPRTLGVPFASVTFFDCDTTTTISKITNLQQLMQQLTQTVEQRGKNLIYAVRIDIDNCDTLLVRSELPQQKPYRPLAEALATDQREFTYQNISGTIVAVYFPSFYTSQNTPGWHCHFISADRTKGGHMLNIATSTSVQAKFDATPYFHMYMPQQPSFAHRDHDKDMSKEIEQVEK